MSWWGKLVGGAFGFMAGGPLGALLGAALGHQVDSGLKQLGEGAPGETERTQTAFFTATFSVMGHVAKADGRVSHDEIALARQVMAQMQLDEAQTRLAINLFNEGKAPDFPLDAVLLQLRRECHRRTTLLQMFLEIQLHAAYADGVMDLEEQRLLLHVFEQLGFSRAEFDHLEALVQGARHFGGREEAQAPTRDRLQEAYSILGVEAEAEDAVVKRAYRRLMNQHHPDKLVARGLPEEMVELATEKTREIREAWETVKRARGMR